MLRNRYSAIHGKKLLGFLTFLILNFRNHKLINLLIIIYLFVRVFILCVFYPIPFYYFLFFLVELIKSIYLLSMCQILYEFPQRTLFFNFDLKHVTTLIFYVLCFPSKVVHLTFPPHIFLSQQSLENVRSWVSVASLE